MKKYNWKQWIPLIHVLNTEDDAATFARFVYPEVL